MSDVDEKPDQNRKRQIDLMHMRGDIKRMALKEKTMLRALRKLRKMLKQAQAQAQTIAHGVAEADAEGVFTARSSPRCSFPVPVPISNPPRNTLEPGPSSTSLETTMSDVDDKPLLSFNSTPGCPTSEYTDGTGAAGMVTLETMWLRRRQIDLMRMRDDIKRMALKEKMMLQALRKLRKMLKQAQVTVQGVAEAEREADAEGFFTVLSSSPASSCSSPRCSFAVPVPISNPPKTTLEPGPSSTQPKTKMLGVSKKLQKRMQMRLQKAVRKLRKRRALQLVPMHLRKEKLKLKQKLTSGDTEEMEEKLLLGDMDEKEKQAIQCVTESCIEYPMEGKNELAMLDEYARELPRKMAPKKVMEALHIVYSKQFAEYDPKMDGFVFTRICHFNIALLDLDEECEAIHGPRLQDLDRKWDWICGISLNVLSLKVVASDVGYPISVYGTVLARDQLDYKCVYLFKREKNYPLLINKPEDMLTLTGPCRGFRFFDRMFFEINLMIKGDETTPDRDLSKGVIQIRARDDMRTVATQLTSWRSTVEIVYAPVEFAVEATIEVIILNGPLDVPFDVNITAWVDGKKKECIILYEYDDEDEDRCTPTRALNTVGLARNLVVVPMGARDEDTLLTVCFSDDKLVPVEVDMYYPLEDKYCNYGPYELQVKVAWTAIQPKSKRTSALLWSRVGIIPEHSYMSWTWELLDNSYWSARTRFV